ncbi:UNVERIFIED_CONTAM: hypothetical protein FKN15_043869 [Acipenser sinensis]
MKGDTPVSSTMSIGQARKLVEQLKIEASMCRIKVRRERGRRRGEERRGEEEIEASMCRIKVSKAAADLMVYCDSHACEDPLITPVPTSENPFREKKFYCALL